MNNLQTKLKYWLQSKNKLFTDFDSFVLDKTIEHKRRIFIDRKSDVLFIAHIDTIQTPKFVRKTKKRIYASGLDDRLGCLLACELSTELNADLLICDFEEQGRSTGQYHKLKNYNWIVEFDRAGKDIVTYDLDSEDFKQALSEFWNIGFGCFSDVCQLKTDVCCLNLGIGYEHAHNKDSFVDLRVLNKQIVKFKQFYQKYKDTQFKQDLINQFDRLDYYDFTTKSQYYGECEICGINADVDYIFGHIICEDCFEDMYNQYCSIIWNDEIVKD